MDIVKSIYGVFCHVLRYAERLRTKLIYDKFYGNIVKDLGIKNTHVEGEEQWIEKWKNMKIKPNPIYYRLFSRYVGKTANIVPEDICRMIVEPCLNPRDRRRFYNDKNNWDLLFPYSHFPKTVIRCIDGMFYSADYKRIPNFGNPQLTEKLMSWGEQKYFVKPTRDSNSSHGTSSINQENGKWYLGKNRNSEITIEEITATSGENFIIQPFQKQHADIAKFCNTAVNPIRIITYKSVKDDKVHVLKGAMLRIGASGEENDGTHGNGKFVGINLDGTMKHEVVDYLGHVTHEFNGVDFTKDHSIPAYDKAREACAEIAEKVMNHRLLAFDVMIDEKGEPIVFEFNIDGFSIWLSQFVGEPAFDDFAEEIIEYSRRNIDKVQMQLII